MTIDENPGRHASETGHWYMACDTGDSVLVGVQDLGEWTCPVLGVARIANVPLDAAIELSTRSEMIQGDVYAIYTVPIADWNEILPEHEVDLEEWGNRIPLVVWLSTDIGGTDPDVVDVIRLHLSFE